MEQQRRTICLLLRRMTDHLVQKHILETDILFGIWQQGRLNWSRLSYSLWGAQQGRTQAVPFLSTLLSSRHIGAIALYPLMVKDSYVDQSGTPDHLLVASQCCARRGGWSAGVYTAACKYTIKKSVVPIVRYGFNWILLLQKYAPSNILVNRSCSNVSETSALFSSILTYYHWTWVQRRPKKSGTVTLQFNRYITVLIVA
jgi:hypothetical protein